MSDTGEVDQASGGSSSQPLRLRKRARGVAQASNAASPGADLAAEYEPAPQIEEQVLRLPRRRRPSRDDYDDYDDYDDLPAQRRRSTRATSRQQVIPRRRSPFAFLWGGLIGAIIIGAGIMSYYYFSKTGPFAVATLPPIVVPTAIDVAGGGDQANTAVLPTKRPTMNASATPVKLFDRGTPGPNPGQLNLPRGIAQDPAGNFFVVDTDNFRIEKFSASGDFITWFGARGAGRGSFQPYSEDSVGAGPSGIAIDKASNLYVADTWSHRIQKFDSTGKFITMWGVYVNVADTAPGTPADDTKFFGPRGVAIGPEGNVYVTDTGNKRVLIFDPEGKFVRKIDSGLTKAKLDANYPFNLPGEMNEPIGIAVDPQGNIYVADTRNERIQKFDKDGKAVAQWPIPAGGWAPSLYMEPFLALDAAGNVYTTAPTTGSVLKFNTEGKVVGEKKSEGPVTLKTPTGITINPDGTIYVVDTGSSAVVNLGKIP